MTVERHELPDATVPANVLIGCPLQQGRLVSVRPTCIACAHHEGLLILNEAEEIPWAIRHQVRCGVPRRLAIMEKVDG